MSAAHSPPGNERRPGLGNRSGEVRRATTRTTLQAATDVLPHIAVSALQEAVNAGLAATWERRAAAFLAARPLPSDFPGQRTPAQHRAKYRELTTVAQACRARAAAAVRHEEVDDDVLEALC